MAWPEEFFSFTATTISKIKFVGTNRWKSLKTIELAVPAKQRVAATIITVVITFLEFSQFPTIFDTPDHRF